MYLIYYEIMPFHFNNYDFLSQNYNVNFFHIIMNIFFFKFNYDLLKHFFFLCEKKNT